MVQVSEGHVGGTCGSSIVSTAADVLCMGGVGGVCEMYMCLGRGVAAWLERSVSG